MKKRQGPTSLDQFSTPVQEIIRHGLNQLNAVDRGERWLGVKPKNAASLIIFKHTEGAKTLEVLLGQRRKDLKFLPGYYVFPGGNLEQEDIDFSGKIGVSPRLLYSLALSFPIRTPKQRLKGLVAAALRECFEETGLLLGRPSETPYDIEEGKRQGGSSGWPKLIETYRKLDGEPNASDWKFIGQAITPPGRIRRFNTRFFLVHNPMILMDQSDQLVNSEFENITWQPLDQVPNLPIHPITATMLALARHCIEFPGEYNNWPCFYTHNDKSHARVL